MKFKQFQWNFGTRWSRPRKIVWWPRLGLLSDIWAVFGGFSHFFFRKSCFKVLVFPCSSWHDPYGETRSHKEHSEVKKKLGMFGLKVEIAVLKVGIFQKVSKINIFFNLNTNRRKSWTKCKKQVWRGYFRTFWLYLPVSDFFWPFFCFF